MPDRLSYLKGYLEQIFILSKFPFQPPRKEGSHYFPWYDDGLERQKFQAYYEEAYNYLSKLDTRNIDDQKYFLLFAEIQEMYTHELSDFDIKQNNRLKKIERKIIIHLLPSNSEISANFNLFFTLVLLIFLVLFGMADSLIRFSIALIFGTMIAIFVSLWFQEIQRANIRRHNVVLVQEFQRLYSKILLFISYLQPIDLLMRSEE